MARRLIDATLLGVGSGLRTFTGPAALAARGRLGGPWGRRVVLAVAAGELVGDKLPAAPPRVQPPALVGRIVAGAFVGQRTAGAAGALIGGLAAGASTAASYRGRVMVVKRTGLPDPLVGAAEDLMAIGLVTFASR